MAETFECAHCGETLDTNREACAYVHKSHPGTYRRLGWCEDCLQEESQMHWMDALGPYTPFKEQFLDIWDWENDGRVPSRERFYIGRGLELPDDLKAKRARNPKYNAMIEECERCYAEKGECPPAVCGKKWRNASKTEHGLYL